MSIESSGYDGGVDFSEVFGVDEVVTEHDPSIGVQVVASGGQYGEVWSSTAAPDAMRSSGIHPGYDTDVPFK
jgi:hypothetical protein